MPYTLTLVSKQPSIATLKLEGGVTVDEMEEHLIAIEKMLVDESLENEKLYLMIDATQVNMDFPSVIMGSRKHVSQRRGSASDPLTQGVFVSTNQMVQLLRDLMAKAPDSYVPIFEDGDKALQYLRDLAAVDRDRENGTNPTRPQTAE